jgi:hypothetical protein
MLSLASCTGSTTLSLRRQLRVVNAAGQPVGPVALEEGFGGFIEGPVGALSNLHGAIGEPDDDLFGPVAKPFLPEAKFFQRSGAGLGHRLAMAVADGARAAAAAVVANIVVERGEHRFRGERHVPPREGAQRLGRPAEGQALRADAGVEIAGFGARGSNAGRRADETGFVAHAGLHAGADLLEGERACGPQHRLDLGDRRCDRLADIVAGRRVREAATGNVFGGARAKHLAGIECRAARGRVTPWVPAASPTA